MPPLDHQSPSGLALAVGKHDMAGEESTGYDSGKTKPAQGEPTRRPAARRTKKQPPEPRRVKNQPASSAGDDPEPQIRSRLERHTALVRAAIRLWELRRRFFD